MISNEKRKIINETFELIKKYFETKDEDIIKTIIMKNMFIVDELIEKNNDINIEKEELYSMLTLQLIEEINGYLKDRFNYKSYYTFYAHINSKLSVFTKKLSNSNKQNNLNLDEITNYPINTTDLIDERISSEEELRNLHEVLEYLDEEEKDIIKMKYAIGYDKTHLQREIAKKYYLNLNSLREKERRTLYKIRVLLKLIEENKEGFKVLNQTNGQTIQSNSVKEITSLNKTSKPNETTKVKKVKKPKETTSIAYKTKTLLKQYAKTKSEITKSKIIEINKERILRIANNYRWEDVDLGKAYVIAYKTFEDSIDKYIELNDDVVSFYTFSDKIIKERLKQESPKNIYKINIKRLLELYANTDNKNRQEEIMNKILEISNNRLIGIIKKYEFLNIPFEELMQVAKDSLVYSVKTFQDVKTPIFGNHSLHIIKRNIEKYAYIKSLKNGFSRTLKI